MHFAQKGPKLGDTLVNYIQYSDHLAILGRMASKLQSHLEKIVEYRKETELCINTEKPKVQIFYEVRLPNYDQSYSFKINEKNLRL